ncbi:hypothetical protein BH11PLA1_BH11PLA1_16130 [soil metagenome]
MPGLPIVIITAILFPVFGAAVFFWWRRQYGVDTTPGPRHSPRRSTTTYDGGAPHIGIDPMFLPVIMGGDSPDPHHPHHHHHTDPTSPPDSGPSDSAPYGGVEGGGVDSGGSGDGGGGDGGGGGGDGGGGDGGGGGGK